MKRTWWALLGAVLMLSLAGCASYYEDRYYYSDRDGWYDDRGYYYTDGYHPRSRYARRFYVAEPYYYDLYDPYLSLFLPFGWAYDPWYYRHYYFGVHLYPYRHFGFAFYGGRPWHYSPWYGGYGLYYPYFYVPTYQYYHGYHGGSLPRDRVVAGPSAGQAARGLAAGLRDAGTGSAPPAPAESGLVRTTAIASDGYANRGDALLGTMRLPAMPGEAPEAGTVRLARMPEVDDSSGLLPADNIPAADRGFDSRNDAWRDARMGSAEGLPLGRGGFPLQTPSAADAGQPLQSIDDTASVLPGREARLQRWSGSPASGYVREPGLQRWPGSESPGGEMRLQRGGSDSWNGGRELRRADPGPSWQGRGDAFGGDSGRASSGSSHFDSPRGGYSSPRMESGSGSSSHGDHDRNQHVE